MHACRCGIHYRYSKPCPNWHHELNLDEDERLTKFLSLGANDKAEESRGTPLAQDTNPLRSIGFAVSPIQRLNDAEDMM